MVIAESKPLEEILSMIQNYGKVLLVGCNGCVAVCSAGGAKEVGILAAALRLARLKEGHPLEVEEVTIQRQCDPEYVEEIRRQVDDCEAILSMACGAGVQYLAERYRDKPVYPAVNTKFIGVTEEQGVWSERCSACGNCILDQTGGICPITRCAKSLLNGPCGGSKDGRCEINPELPCAWQLIYERLKALDQLDRFEQIIPIRDWSTGRDGGPRTVVREDLRL